MLKTSRDTATLSFSECDCISFEFVDAKERLISFETGRNFRGHASVFTLLLTSISVTFPHCVTKPLCTKLLLARKKKKSIADVIGSLKMNTQAAVYINDERNVNEDFRRCPPYYARYARSCCLPDYCR